LAWTRHDEQWQSKEGCGTCVEVCKNPLQGMVHVTEVSHTPPTEDSGRVIVYHGFAKRNSCLSVSSASMNVYPGLKNPTIHSGCLPLKIMIGCE
jgi:hypothetical protein